MNTVSEHQKMVDQLRKLFDRLQIHANETQISALASILRTWKHQIVMDTNRKRDIAALNTKLEGEKADIVVFDEVEHNPRPKSVKKHITCPWCSGTHISLICGGRVTDDGMCGECDEDGKVAVYTTD